MQPDFMGMAQGQAAPQEELTQEDVNEIGYTSEDFETMDMPGGDDIESVKQRLMMLLEQSSILEMFQGPAQLQQLTQLVNELAQAMVDQDIEKIKANKLFQLIQNSMEETGALKEMEQPTGGPVPQQGAPTKDFASMMPPAPGGGLGGR
jgi:hypothetical protein